MQINKEGPHVFCFFGRSGSGKGVQSQRMITHLKEISPEREVLYIETGRLFREFIAENEDHSADLVKEVIDNGGLLPAFLPVWMWSDFLIKKYTGNESLVFDGIARRLRESPILEEALRFYKCVKPFVVYIDVSPECVMERLKKRGRIDDTEEKIKDRLEWYEENVVPSIEFFRKSESVNFVSVNGEQDPDEVHREIVGKTLRGENDKN